MTTRKSKEDREATARERSPMMRKLLERAEREQISIRVPKHVLSYFRAMAEREGVPYQSLLNVCLEEATRSKWGSDWSQQERPSPQDVAKALETLRLATEPAA